MKFFLTLNKINTNLWGDNFNSDFYVPNNYIKIYKFSI